MAPPGRLGTCANGEVSIAQPGSRSQRAELADDEEGHEGDPGHHGGPRQQPEQRRRQAGDGPDGRHPHQRRTHHRDRRAGHVPDGGAVGQADAEAHGQHQGRRRDQRHHQVAGHPGRPGDGGRQHRLGAQGRLLPAQAQDGLHAVRRGNHSGRAELGAEEGVGEALHAAHPGDQVLGPGAVEEAAELGGHVAQHEGQHAEPDQPGEERAALQAPRQAQRRAEAAAGGGRAGPGLDQPGAEVAPVQQGEGRADRHQRRTRGAPGRPTSGRPRTGGSAGPSRSVRATTASAARTRRRCRRPPRRKNDAASTAMAMPFAARALAVSCAATAATAANAAPRRPREAEGPGAARRSPAAIRPSAVSRPSSEAGAQA